jgi:hypothetical protein
MQFMRSIEGSPDSICRIGRTMTPKFFGCYDHFYNTGTSYIRLLYLGGPKVNKSIVELSALPSHESWTEDTIRLLAEKNWRYHLAPLVAYLFLTERSVSIEQSLWSCIANGSWVSPQIVVCLHIKGVDVVSNTITIIKNGIDSGVTDPITAHIEVGPGSMLSRKGKLLNAVIGLGLRDKIAMTDDEINRIISLDIDCADKISSMWHRNAIHAFSDIHQVPSNSN